MESLFAGKKAKWLPLYKRLMARSKELASAEPHVGRSFLQLGQIAKLRVTPQGIELSLRIRSSPRSAKVTIRKVVLTETDQIDEDLLTWIKTASLLAATSLKLSREKAQNRKRKSKSKQD
jgi:hypothetical protein